MKALTSFAAITTLIGSVLTVAVPPAIGSAAAAAQPAKAAQRACAWRVVASPNRAG
jgi:hypothetical protein